MTDSWGQYYCKANSQDIMIYVVLPFCLFQGKNCSVFQFHGGYSSFPSQKRNDLWNPIAAWKWVRWNWREDRESRKQYHCACGFTHFRSVIRKTLQRWITLRVMALGYQKDDKRHICSPTAQLRIIHTQWFATNVNKVDNVSDETAFFAEREEITRRCFQFKRSNTHTHTHTHTKALKWLLPGRT